MFFRIFTILLILSSITIAQTDYDLFLKAEKEKYVKILEASEINYPGDSKIDVTYYGLELNLTYEPAYLIGAVRIDIRIDTTSANSFFIDLISSVPLKSAKSNSAINVLDISCANLSLALW